jgi:acyl-CoA synthetase (AMP-forming)/AMP-acid ligase II/1-acyl-sn-glycerol-3-phosphate acyltransferase/acyl carrier protein
MVGRLIFFLIRRILSLRYRIEVRGLEKLELKKPGGILFLSNHPALVDPIISASTFWPRFRVRPLIIDYMYNIGLSHWFMAGVLRAVSVPDFARGSNSYKRMLADGALDTIVTGLKEGDNFIVYPAGRIQRTPEELLGGASAGFEIAQRSPDANIVGLRVRGLWGSMFGWGVTGEWPRLGQGFKKGFVIILKNLIFFTPRRKVTIDVELLDPPVTNRKTFNHFLEDWFNAPMPGAAGAAEPLTLVSYSRWRQELPKVSYKRPFQDGDVDRVPKKVQETVLHIISRLSKREPEEISAEMHLFTDLGLDSLDIADLVLSLPNVTGLPSDARLDMMTVGAVMALAAGEWTVGPETPVVPVDGWVTGEKRPPAALPEGETIHEAFLRAADRMGNAIACADEVAGTLSYKKMRRAALVLAEHLRSWPEETVGVMLPASCGVAIAVLAIQLAGKVPVMVNWTVGARYLETVKSVAKVQHVLTSERFLGQLDGADLTPIHDQLVTLEAIRKKITWREKWRGSRRKTTKMPSDKPAVILFTSGTEALPKAVPLSHSNILFNQRAAGHTVAYCSSDAIYSILPPFHSLGFTVTTFFPLVTGGKVFFSPDPTDARRLAGEIEAYRPTLICAAPTFLKGIKAVSRPEQLAALRLMITGAEKAPEELFEWVDTLPSELIEGYGITECSPILTINRLGQPRRGVGEPIEGVELAIVDLESRQPLPDGEVGLILARGPGVFSGYLGTDKDPFVEVEGKRWYNTGDLGRLDEVGALHLAGRLKRFVKMGGEMMSLPALETALEGAFEGQLAVVAREEEGQRPELHLFTTEEIALEAANQAIRNAGMGALAKLSQVHQIAHMPVMGTGKIHFRKLQEMVESR